ncbi:MAG: T9SS type A sorting domain-containing protein [Flavobacteriales bacterium]|nr:T9SS type A sorting domain-containing protein [Flavobacteriales bacterium]
MKKNLYQLIKLHNKYISKYTSGKATSHKILKKIKRFREQIGFENKFRKLELSLLASGLILIGSTQANAQISFGSTQTNPFNIQPASETWSQPRFIDLDGDGDLDITNVISSEFVFIENIGTSTSPNFTAPDTNSFNIPGGFLPPNHDFCDLDNDGDYDLMIYEYSYLFSYYENIGSSTNPSFGTVQTYPFNLPSTGQHFTPDFVDLDNDGDFDLMMGNYNGGFTYYENTGTASSPSFAAATTNPFGLLTSSSGFYTKLDFADLDNDGDLDLMAAFSVSGDAEIRYYENIGSASTPNFAAAQTDPFGLPAADKIRSCSFGDLDGDGDMDLLSTDIHQDLTLPGNPWVIDYLYYENTTPNTSLVSEQNEIGISVFPNPATNELNIVTEENDVISIINVLGEIEMKTNINVGQTVVDISPLPAGIYFLKSEKLDSTLKIIKN